MIHKFVLNDFQNWNKCFEPLMLAVKKILQASTEFSLFLFLCRHKPCGISENKLVGKMKFKACFT